LRRHKPEILAWLRRRETLRAALDRTIESGPLTGMPDRRWQQFEADAEVFIRDFGATAAALGWDATDLFGHDSVAPWQRVDRLGLVWLLDGRAVIALSDRAASILAAGGGALTFSRRRYEPQKMDDAP